MERKGKLQTVYPEYTQLVWTKVYLLLQFGKLDIEIHSIYRCIKEYKNI